MKLTLLQAAQQLIEEMDISLALGEILTLDKDILLSSAERNQHPDDLIEMVDLHDQYRPQRGRKHEPYGIFILITNREGAVQSATYLGQYPGLSEKLLFGDKVDLDLDTRVLYPKLGINSPEALVRIDHYEVPFLGKRYDELILKIFGKL